MSSNIKKVLAVLVIALAIYLLVSQPHESAGWTKGLLAQLRQGADQIITFIRSLFG